MRWPIRAQLLVPFLGVVVSAIGVSSGVTAYFGAAWARERVVGDLERVSSTLASAGFPLTESVLEKMRGLSGGEFVVVGAGGEVRCATVSLAGEELAAVGELRRRGDRKEFSLRATVRVQGRGYLAAAVPVVARAEQSGPAWLFILYPEDKYGGAIRRAIYPPLVVGALAAGVVVAVTMVLARRFAGPIRQLAERAGRIAGGDFGPVAVPDRDDEIRELGQSINHMAAKLREYEVEVRRSERLRALGQLGGGLAHQLRNSATGARMAIELHRRECSQGGRDEALEVALRQLSLMESYVRRFLGIGRGAECRPRALEVDSLVREVGSLVRPACEHGGIKLEVGRAGEPFVVWGDADGLRQVLLNLVLNAIEAAGRGAKQDGVVSIGVESVGDRELVIRVSDSGPGPSAAVGEQLFEPFVTDKPDGTGLGLMAAREIAREHGGEITWERNGGLTSFVVRLPRHEVEVSDGSRVSSGR